MAVEIGLAVIGALLIGLPLAAVLGARRLPPPRRRAVRPDPLFELARRHRLQGNDLLRVQDAVSTGVQVERARLRVAAVEYAELVLQQQGRVARPAWLRRRRWRYLAFAVYLGFVAAVLVAAPGAVGGLASGIVIPLVRRQQRRMAEQAIAANSAPSAPLEHDTSDGA